MTQKEKDSIYRDYNKKVFYYFRGKGLNEDDAEDLMATVFVKFYNSIESFDSTRASPSTFLYRVTHNTLIDFYRTKKQFSELDEEISYDDKTVDNILSQETLTELGQALMRLEERERALIVLVYYDGKSLKESAEILKMSYSNSKLVMKKALSELKGFLE
ncbi:sigma-70 family RNA polymerase sigma factor [uncultured Treponema sp.]|uniref:RNA polymerase sigma factor n=1 Tax=uncultured Treponema sp. TaxID=162155 RepID=UPI0025F1F8AA|nr:sigma-70 family RNA polymerase sigma factor [uncultured Treponema sp.]